MAVSDTKQKLEWLEGGPACEPVCESLPDSKSERSSAADEMLAVCRDVRTGRYASTAPGIGTGPDVEVPRALGFETRFQAGNQGGRRHGVRAFQTNGASTLPPDLRGQLDAFRAGLEDDQGGAAELTTIGSGYVRRLTQLEACLSLLIADLETRGLLTARGRVRNSYMLLLQSIDRWDKLAQRLGMTRRTKRLPSLQEYLEHRTAGTDVDGPVVSFQEMKPDGAPQEARDSFGQS
jgi:hypothetical protein